MKGRYGLKVKSQNFRDKRRQDFLIFLQMPNDFGFKLFVTALFGSQEMFLTLPPLVENRQQPQ